MRLVSLALFFFLLSLRLFAQEASFPWTVQSIRAVDGQLYFASIFRLPPGQSVYWINPGNSGSPISLKFKLGEEDLQLEERAWSVPMRHAFSLDLHTYTLENQVVLFYLVPGEIQDKIYDQDLSIEAKWLTCSDICLQGDEILRAHFIHDKLTLIDIPKFSLPDEGLLEIHRNRAKEEEEWPASVDLLLGINEGGQSFLFYSTNELASPKWKKQNLIYPFPHDGLSFLQEQLLKDRSQSIYGIFPIDGEITFPFTFKALLNFNDHPVVASKIFQNFTPELQSKVASLKSVLTPILPELGHVEQMKDMEKKEDSKTPFSYFLLMAFLGGLILNIMPCVLPVISLKLFGLIKINGSSHKEIFIHNLFYTFGILFTFLIFASIVSVLKATGELVGWGFQMQSPSFLIVMILVLVLFSLNLFGLYEFRTPGGKYLGNINIHGQVIGSFVSGILAVILSTPCSAPFLGTALTFAFTTSTLNLVTLLLMIGFGLAFPILLTGIFPRLISFLPRPGNWMNHLKKILGLSLVATAIWLITIFNTLTSNPFNQGALYQLLIIIAAIALAAIILSRFPKLKWGAIVIFIIAAGLTADLFTAEYVRYPNTQKDNSKWIHWSVEALEKEIHQRPVFVKLSADWCITCKVDQKLIINTKDFDDIVKRYNLKLVLGDYTSPEMALERWMQDNNIVGVPAYLIQLKNGKKIKIEGQLTLDKVSSVLDQDSL